MAPTPRASSIPPVGQNPKRWGILNLKTGNGRYGINWGSKKYNDEGARRLAGINFPGYTETRAKTQAGINLSAISVSSHKDEHPGIQYGVNAALASTRKSTLGLNISFGSVVYRAQSGINLGVCQCGRHYEASQNGINIGILANAFPRQRGVNAGSINIADQFGLNIGLLNQDANQLAYLPNHARIYGGQKGATFGLVNAVGNQQGFSFGLLNFAGSLVGGVQVSPIASFVGRLRGLAVGAFQSIKDVKGVALSAVSWAGRVAGTCISAVYASARTLEKGVLIAPITRVIESRNSNGIQVGIINIRDDAGERKYSFGWAVSRKKE